MENEVVYTNGAKNVYNVTRGSLSSTPKPCDRQIRQWVLKLYKEVWLFNSSGQQKGHYDDQATINGQLYFSITPTGWHSR